MQTGIIGREIIEKFEGLEKAIANRPGFYTPYRDSVNVITVGYGHTNLGDVPPRVVEGSVWSRQECDSAMAADLGKFEHRVNSILAGVPLSQDEFDALVSFDFNTGGLNRSSIPGKIKAGRKAEVPEVLMRWNKAGGNVLPGLTRRRDSEGKLFAGNEAAALRVAGVHVTSGDGMARQVQKPTPPPAEIVRRTAKETTIAVGSGTGGTAAQVTKPAAQTQQPGVPPVPKVQPDSWHGLAAFIGFTIAAVAVIFLVRKVAATYHDWA